MFLKQRKLLFMGFDQREIDYYGLMEKPEAEILSYMPAYFTWNNVRPSLNSAVSKVLNDKWMSQLYMDQVGIPMPHLIGLWDPSFGMAPGGAPFRTVEDFAREIRSNFDVTDDVEVFFKPQAGRVGDGAFAAKIYFQSDGVFAKLSGQEPLPLHELLSALRTDALSHFETAPQGWIVQKRVYSHSIVSAINPSSLNTARLITHVPLNRTQSGSYDDVDLMVSYLKIGRIGNETEMSGGINCLIDPDTGRLAKFGRHFLEDGGAISESHPDSGLKYSDVVLPFWEKAKEVCCKSALYFPDIRTIAWDVAFTKDGPFIVEANGGWNHVAVQAFHGFLTPERRAKLENENVPLPPATFVSNATYLKTSVLRKLSKVFLRAH